MAFTVALPVQGAVSERGFWTLNILRRTRRKAGLDSARLLPATCSVQLERNDFPRACAGFNRDHLARQAACLYACYNRQYSPRKEQAPGDTGINPGVSWRKDYDASIRGKARWAFFSNGLGRLDVEFLHSEVISRRSRGRSVGGNASSGRDCR